MNGNESVGVNESSCVNVRVNERASVNVGVNVSVNGSVNVGVRVRDMHPHNTQK